MNNKQRYENKWRVNKDNEVQVIKLCVLAVIGVLLFVFAEAVFKEEFEHFFKWWLVLMSLGITFFPLSAWLFNGFHDSGWIFSKVTGIAVSGWLMWLLASTKLMKFSFAGCLISVFVCLFGNILILIWRKKHDKKRINNEFIGSYCFDYKKIASIVSAEVIFLALFIFWTYLKGFRPEAYGTTEKMMDYGFMNAIMKSEYMPPEDLWLAGKPINYYYAGQFIATYLSKLSGIGIEYGYNFMLMTLAAMGFSLPYSLIHNVMGDFVKSKGNVVKSIIPKLSGTVSGIAVAFAGNMHYGVYALFIPWCRTTLGLDKLAEKAEYKFPSYWFPNATRYIGYNPETTDKTIHEFPSYSFILGDLHAHVINIIFVLTVVGILYAWLQYKRRTIKHISENTKTIWGIPGLMHELFNPSVILVGFFIGLFHMTNFWDYPIYYVVAGAVILFSNAVEYDFSRITVKLTALQGVLVIVVAKLCCLPFTLNFNQISTAIRLTENRTPLYQLAILWGLPVTTVFVFLVIMIKKHGAESKGSEGAVKGRNRLFSFIGGLGISELFILILGLCGIGLVIIPELIYVKDIYSGDYKRANTMFKLTYQAFIMFGMAMGYILTRLLVFSETKHQRRFSVVAICFLIVTVGYFFNGIGAWFGDYLNYDSYKGLNAAEFLEAENSEDSQAVDWINGNITGRPVMLEVNGDSYTYHNRISVMTGLPTVLGWKTHEWLWQSDSTSELPKIVSERDSDVKTLYTSEDRATVMELVNKYNIEYIYVGELEKNKYDVPLNHDMMFDIGEVVYPTDFKTGDRYDTTYIIKIKK